MANYRTIADFRKDSGPAITQVWVQFIELCRLMGLLTQASVAIDGSKFKVVNTRDKNFTRGRWSDAAPNWRRAWRAILRTQHGRPAGAVGRAGGGQGFLSADSVLSDANYGRIQNMQLHLLVPLARAASRQRLG